MQNLKDFLGDVLILIVLAILGICVCFDCWLLRIKAGIVLISHILYNVLYVI